MSGAGGFASVLAFGLAADAAVALVAWWASLRRNDVSLVDAFWGPMIVLPAGVVAALLPAAGSRAWLVLALAASWAARLSLHIVHRSRGKPEDPRYQAIRARNEPGFRFKSLYLVFLLQAVLAWCVSWPLAAAVASPRPVGVLDVVGLMVAVGGLSVEAVADAQLARFRADPSNRGRVLDTGLWRYSRHPNYFGECCLWWGFGLVAVSAGAPWSLVSPVLMTVLLLKVSGVALLERDIGERRPAYRDYVARTPAFVPWWPK